MLYLTAIGEEVAGTYICDSPDDYATWVYFSDEISIVVHLGEITDAPQWNVFVTVRDDEARYQGEVMSLPIYRVDADVKKVQGGARWPDHLTLGIN